LKSYNLYGCYSYNNTSFFTAENYRNAEEQIVSKSKCFEDSRSLYDEQYSDYNYIKNLNIFEGTYIEGINSVNNVEMDSSVIDYLKKSGNQYILGNYTEDVTLLGTFMQVGTGLLGVDLPMDLRDIFYDFTHWKWSWGHAGQTAVDLLSLLPIIGGLKYADEAGALAKAAFKNTDETGTLVKGALKSSDEISDIAKGVDETVEIAAKGVTQAEKLSMNQIDDLIEEIGGSIKNHPLRQEYENAVKNLSNYEVELRGKGLNKKEIAQAMHQARRDLGVQYKNLTPDALREYIYEVNIKRYDGDPLGGSFEIFENKYMGDYSKIIEGAESPNGNVDKLLEGFKKWLIEKNK